MADLRGARGMHAPPGGPNSFNFMQFLGKFGKIVCWRPPGELVPPPRRNPGSATVMCSFGQNIGLLILVLIASQTQAPIVKVACKTATNLSPYLR